MFRTFESAEGSRMTLHERVNARPIRTGRPRNRQGSHSSTAPRFSLHMR
jgi:hypothetical protein